MVLDFLAVDNFDFTRKIVKKNLGEKLVKMLGFCQTWIFGQKFDFPNSVLRKPRHPNYYWCELNHWFSSLSLICIWWMKSSPEKGLLNCATPRMRLWFPLEVHGLVQDAGKLVASNDQTKKQEWVHLHLWRIYGSWVVRTLPVTPEKTLCSTLWQFSGSTWCDKIVCRAW